MRRLFATIADRYDFITVALSYGQDRRWKRRLVALALPVAGRRALDLATGTGDIAYSLASSGARVVGLDITPRMIELAIGKKSEHAGSCSFVVGDMLTLPFPDRSFDLVTTGYGLRNVPNLAGAVDEIARVLAPGGFRAVARFQPSGEWSGSRGLLAVPDACRQRSGLASAWRSRHLSVHTGIDSSVSWCRGRWPVDGGARFHGHPLSPCARRIDGDTPRTAVRLKHDGRAEAGHYVRHGMKHLKIVRSVF